MSCNISTTFQKVSQVGKTLLNSELESNLGLFSSGKVQLFIDQYVKSDQGILILLILFVVLLILVFNFFVREK